MGKDMGKDRGKDRGKGGEHDRRQRRERPLKYIFLRSQCARMGRPRRVGRRSSVAIVENPQSHLAGNK